MARRCVAFLHLLVLCRRSTGAELEGAEHFPIVYVVYGPGGVPTARAIVRPEDTCPILTVMWGDAGGGALPKSSVSSVRGVGTAEMPYAFPVKVCEVTLPRDLPAAAATFGGKPVPKITRDPSRMVLIGDTGLRVHPKNVGTCSKKSHRELYGVPVCDAQDVIPFNASLVSGVFQSLSDWPLVQQTRAAAQGAPDLVVHVGDYLYRQGPCAQDKGCAAINNASYPRTPGDWGDNWRGWFSDFFRPAQELLSSAPWVVLRGNHEQCDRGGHGFFFFMDPRPLPSNWTTDYCVDYTDTYTVPFNREQFFIIDDSVIEDVRLDKHCPTDVTAHGEALPLSRYHDTWGKLSHAAIHEQIEYFKGQFEEVERSALPNVSNFLLTHRPVFGIACHKGFYISLDWTLQQALGNSRLGRFSAAIHGHVHWFQNLIYEGHKLPMDITVGNGGTELDHFDLNSPEPMVGLQVLGVPIESAFTAQLFGFSFMTRQPDGNYALDSLQVGNHGVVTGASPHIWSTVVPSVQSLSQGTGQRRLSAAGPRATAVFV